MNYLEARKFIQSGDVIGVEGGTFWSKITRLVQKLAGHGSHANVTHYAMAWWLEGRLYLVEMDGKHNVLRPMSQYKMPMRWHKCPVNREHVKELFPYMTQDLISYSVLQNILSGLRILRRSKREIAEADGENCSQFVARWLKLAGWGADLPTDPTPSEVDMALGNDYVLIN
jgi:hypothetical protein